MIRLLPSGALARRNAIASVTAMMMLAAAGCAASERTDTAAASQSGTQSIAVAPGVRLEVLDWGGAGPPMVFLAGSGMNAASYERFATRFRDRYHVYGINRRGAGASSVPATGYDAATRAHDIVTVLDSLHVDKAVLVGHSFAGDELSKVGVTYPSRVRALVYLDAYNHPAPGADKLPPLPVQATSGRKAPQAKSTLVSSLEATDTDTISRPPAVEPLDTDSLARAGAEHADYSRIAVPALAIYADQPMTAAAVFDREYEHFDARNKAMAQRFVAALMQERKDDQQQFRTQVRQGKVVVIPGADHLIYLSDPDEVEQAMRRFLVTP